MKKQIKKWTVRIAATGFFILAFLLVIILNPVLTYANKTAYNNYTIYHNQPLDVSLLEKLEHATLLLKNSELYNSKLKLEICLNDGSSYPKLMRVIRGEAFAWGFYDKVVLQGTANCKANTVELNGYHWNLTQLLAHEFIHCLQFDKLGFWRSKPIAKIANWKWEGYAEYIARQAETQHNLIENIERLINADKVNADTWEVIFADKTIAPKEYYKYWLLVQYCIDIKKMSYQQVLADTTGEESIQQEMMDWYKNSTIVK